MIPSYITEIVTSIIGSSAMVIALWLSGLLHVDEVMGSIACTTYSFFNF